MNKVFFCGNDRLNEINTRMYERNVPSQTLQNQFSIRPVSTKYDMMSIIRGSAGGSAPSPPYAGGSAPSPPCDKNSQPTGRGIVPPTASGIVPSTASGIVPPTASRIAVFNPGNAEGEWSGYASKINDDSRMKNLFFAHQSGAQGSYIPDSTSDMYQAYTGDTNQYIQQPYPDLFSTPDLPPFNPNPYGIATNFFENSTRQQFKSIKKGACPL